MASTTRVVSAYTTFAASTMLIRTIMNEFQNVIPKDKIISKFGIIIGSLTSTMCITIDETNGFSNNQVYEAADIYLRTIITPSIKHLKASKTPRDKNLTISIDRGQQIIDGISLQWKSIVVETQKTNFDDDQNSLTVDLNRFVRRRKFYKRVGKAWKRGYLLYGPPGTRKSSLVAAMANYLKFDIYDLELSSLRSNAELRRLMASTKNRSILVIEDIDCSIDLENRQDEGRYSFNHRAKQKQKKPQLTLSGLLNFVDGIWSCCGDERIIVFTTNHKDRLDPALLRPGRMDMHVHMSYCTFSGFKILASNYLGIEGHSKFSEIERMMAEVEVTPAEIAEELMKSEEVEKALEKVVELLEEKRGSEGREEDV
ncbi:hypothetical protein DH2020_003766 [Rehmannia glutinosa]|uniref:AAA+ ATPase domain-containing protein n=1 Tax=Rehmannia glutinosa TaxID=99300 RepID=A0ABR0XMQ0_REHGL